MPEFFLRRFGTGDGDVHLVERGDLSHSFTTNVVNAIVQSHFYTLETDEGRNADVERYFATEIEGPAARAIRRVVDEGRFPPLPGLRRDLSAFFAFQFVRGEASRHAVLSQYELLAKQLASHMTPEMARRQLRKEGGSDPTEDEVSALVSFARASDSYGVDFDKKANLHLGQALSVAGDLVPYFERRCWNLVTFPAPVLITGDEPVALVGRTTRPEGPLGIATADEIVVPLDPQHAVILGRPDLPGGDDERSIRGTGEMARVINLNLAFGCHRFIVHRPGTEPLRGISLPAKGPTAEMRGNVLAVYPRPGPKPKTRRRT